MASVLPLTQGPVQIVQGGKVVGYGFGDTSSGMQRWFVQYDCDRTYREPTTFKKLVDTASPWDLTLWGTRINATHQAGDDSGTTGHPTTMGFQHSTSDFNYIKANVITAGWFLSASEMDARIAGASANYPPAPEGGQGNPEEVDPGFYVAFDATGSSTTVIACCFVPHWISAPNRIEFWFLDAASFPAPPADRDGFRLELRNPTGVQQGQAPTTTQAAAAVASLLSSPTTPTTAVSYETHYGRTIPTPY